MNRQVLVDLKTLTFGVNFVSYLAIRTMIQLANCMYVEDTLVETHSIEMAIKCRKQIIQALASAGFSMRK